MHKPIENKIKNDETDIKMPTIAGKYLDAATRGANGGAGKEETKEETYKETDKETKEETDKETKDINTNIKKIHSKGKRIAK
jgi:predicted RNase H-like nuclease (RuvC/YqgF family)